MELTATKIEDVQVCDVCGRPVMPTGIWMMPLEGFCDCVLWRKL